MRNAPVVQRIGLWPTKPAIEVRILSGAQMEFWQTWCMRRTENPENVVRFHETPHMVMIVQLVRTPDCGSGGHGFEARSSP